MSNTQKPGVELREAVAALNAGRPEQAIALTDRIDRASDIHWIVVRALALAQCQRASEALPLFEALVEREPQSPTHWTNLGNCLCELARERDALKPLQRAVELGARGLEIDFALARSLVAHARAREALPLVVQALRAAPQDVEVQILRARCLVMLDEYDAAGEALDELKVQPLPVSLRIDAGNLLLQLGLYEDAAASFSLALAADPGVIEQVDACLGLAAVHERCNRLAEAEASLQQARERRPQMDAARIAQLDELEAQLASRSGDHADACAILRAILGRNEAVPMSDPLQRGDLWLKLGRACDALELTADAMAALETAHRIRFDHVTATHAAMPRGDGLLAVLEADAPPAITKTSVDDEQVDPVFLVGFPRSGTTLLEQLLDAHPALASFDEQPFLQRLVTRLDQRVPGYPAALASLEAEQVRSLRAGYFADVTRVLPGQASCRAVDKNPLNLVRLPLVSALFPRAQVLLALRHPCDVVLSCYMQNFRSPAFSITFETLASTARMYARVMEHYHRHAAQLNVAVHVVRYEDLVADVEGVARKLFEFLDLEWIDELVAFTERARAKGAISTPSYAQVVQPVNRRAVGRWQRYAPWFQGEPLDALRPWIERFGYRVD